MMHSKHQYAQDRVLFCCKEQFDSNNNIMSLTKRDPRVVLPRINARERNTFIVRSDRIFVEDKELSKKLFPTKNDQPYCVPFCKDSCIILKNGSVYIERSLETHPTFNSCSYYCRSLKNNNCISRNTEFCQKQANRHNTNGSPENYMRAMVVVPKLNVTENERVIVKRDRIFVECLELAKVFSNSDDFSDLLTYEDKYIALYQHKVYLEQCKVPNVESNLVSEWKTAHKLSENKCDNSDSNECCLSLNEISSNCNSSGDNLPGLYSTKTLKMCYTNNANGYSGPSIPSEPFNFTLAKRNPGFQISHKCGSKIHEPVSLLNASRTETCQHFHQIPESRRDCSVVLKRVDDKTMFLARLGLIPTSVSTRKTQKRYPKLNSFQKNKIRCYNLKTCKIILKRIKMEEYNKLNV